MGLDVSSTTIGLSIVKEEDGKFSLEHTEYYKPSKKNEDVFQTLHETKEWIKERIETLKPDDVAVEDIAKHFSVGSSSANTVIVLAIFIMSVGVGIFDGSVLGRFLLWVRSVSALL